MWFDVFMMIKHRWLTNWFDQTSFSSRFKIKECSFDEEHSTRSLPTALIPIDKLRMDWNLLEYDQVDNSNWLKQTQTQWTITSKFTDCIRMK